MGTGDNFITSVSVIYDVQLCFCLCLRAFNIFKVGNDSYMKHIQSTVSECEGFCTVTLFCVLWNLDCCVYCSYEYMLYGDMSAC